MVVGFAASHSAVLAAPSDGGGLEPVKIVPVAGDVTVSWQIRSGATVRLRLYRAFPNGSESLVGEFVARPGVERFRQVDDRRSLGSALYVLRVLGSDGSETTLGSVLCVEPKFAPGVATSAWSPSQQVCTLETVELPTPGWAPLVSSIASSSEGWIPAPEPPVPRLS